MPELPPLLIFQSISSSKFAYWVRVTMSLVVVSLVIVPSTTYHAEMSALRYPRHWSMVLPSNRECHGPAVTGPAAPRCDICCGGAQAPTPDASAMARTARTECFINILE